MHISTEIYHLQKLPRYASEKPYTMRYVPEGNIAVSNVIREKHLVAVQDMRGSEDEYQIDKNGFTISQLATEMTYEDYDDRVKVETVYLPELKQILNQHFPGSTTDFVSYLIRKRDSSFPYSTGERYSFGQPNIVAHIDATNDDLVRQIVRRHGVDAQRLLNSRCQYITLWKPLRGPLHDYPLALCDKRSINLNEDLEPQDIVDRDEVLENVHVYHRPQHQWKYLSGQLDSEVLVFRQADTQSEGFGQGTPHCAIANPNAPEYCLPRESIEVVAFLFGPD